MRARAHEPVGGGPQRMGCGATEDRLLHHDAARAEHHGTALGREPGAEEDATVRPDGDIAAHYLRRCDIGAVVDAGTTALVLQQHGSSAVSDGARSGYRAG